MEHAGKAQRRAKSGPGQRCGLLGLIAAMLAPGGGDLPAAAQGKAPRPAAIAAAEAATLSLTASDGTGLELTSLTAQVVLEDPLAFTELHLAFRNPEDRVREGRFRITLPSGAVISRFAMKIDGRLQEGEVVELQAARQAYEDFLHRRQDPALLETEAGNEFSARVFPIPARGSKELIVSYSQELVRSGESYRLPLKGLPRLGSLQIRAHAGKLIEIERHNEIPQRDFEVALPEARRLGLRHDNLVVARVRPLDSALPPDPIERLTVLVDSSASRAVGWNEQLTLLTQVLAGLHKGSVDPQVVVAAFDQSLEVIHEGRASGFSAAVAQRLRDRKPLGASNLAAALDWVRGHKGAQRVLLVSDGVATAGETDNGKLHDRVHALTEAQVARLDVLAVGGIRDDERLSRLVSSGLPHAGVVLGAALGPAEITRRLGQEVRSGLPVQVPGAAWIWPVQIDGVQPGDEVLVYADLPAGKAFQISVGGKVMAGGELFGAAPAPLLERAWVKARMARLMAQRDAAASAVTGDKDVAEGLLKQVIDLSIKHRVLSPYTALLVLETEQDYRRFGIERRALADILTVGPAGITVAQRRDFVVNQVARDVVDDDVIEGFDQDDSGASARPLRMRDARPAAKAKAAAGPREERVARRAESAAMPAPVLAQAPAFPAMTAAAAPVPAASAPGAQALAGAAAPAFAAAPAAAPPSERRMLAPEPMAPRHRARAALAAEDEAAAGTDGFAPSLPAYEGALAEVMQLLGRGLRKEAFSKALAWHESAPGDVLALVALGEAAEALGDGGLAARSYGSLIDLFPGRADLRRFAGNRLERLNGEAPVALAIDSYRKAVEQRPDHPAGHRLLAFALLKAGRPAEAFEVLAAGARRDYPEGRFAGVARILREDLGLVAAAWTRAQPARASEIAGRLTQAGGHAETGASLRFVLTWETDANDVDFHIRDGRGGHAYYSQRTLASGGELYADVTTGYGPECFTIRGPAVGRAYPYRLQAHYYSRGPMGYGMGKLQVIEHDGRGGLRFEERPFVVMRDNAFVEMGTVAGAGPKLVAR